LLILEPLAVRTAVLHDIEKGVCSQVFKGTATARCLKILMPVRVEMMPDDQAKMVPKMLSFENASHERMIHILGKRNA
jgi:hypothetical protein